jgi:hypothetical protein
VPHLPPPNRTSDSVTFHDHRGRLWTAREVDCPDHPDARPRRCLLLDSAAGSSHVWTYPGDWRTLSAEGLIALLSAR